MKIIKKITITLLIAIISLFSITSLQNKVQAASISEIISGANDFVNKGEADQENTIDRAKLKEGANLIYSIFLAIGIFLATVVGIIVGIKLMAAGTASEKAQYKKVLEVYLAGCIVIFGAGGIWKLVIDTVNGVTPTATTSAQADQQAQLYNTLSENEKSLAERREVEEREKQEAQQKADQEKAYNEEVEKKQQEIALRNQGRPEGATSVPDSALYGDLSKYKEDAEREVLDEFIKNVTPEQNRAIRKRALENMGIDPEKISPAPGATSVSAIDSASIPDGQYRKAALEILKGD